MNSRVSVSLTLVFLIVSSSSAEIIAAGPGELSATSETGVLGYTIIKEESDAIEFEVEYNYKIPPGQLIGLQCEGLRNGEHLGLFGHQRVVMPSGHQRVRTRMFYIQSAPPRTMTDQLEFSLYYSGGSPFLSRAFPYKKLWSQKGLVLTGDEPSIAQGTEVGETVAEFTLKDSHGTPHAFRRLIRGRSVVLYAVPSTDPRSPFGDTFTAILQRVNSVAKQHNILMVGLQTPMAGLTPAASPPGTILIDPTGALDLAFHFKGCVIINQRGVIRKKDLSNPYFIWRTLGLLPVPKSLAPPTAAPSLASELRRLQKPDWWKECPSFPVESSKELASVSQKARSNPKQFFKSAFQAIVAHPTDIPFVLVAVNAMRIPNFDAPMFVTVEEVIWCHGFIGYKVRSVPLERITDVVISRTLGEMAAGISSIDIRDMTGQTQPPSGLGAKWIGVKDAPEIPKRILEEIKKVNERSGRI